MRYLLLLVSLLAIVACSSNKDTSVVKQEPPVVTRVVEVTREVVVVVTATNTPVLINTATPFPTSTATPSSTSTVLVTPTPTELPPSDTSTPTPEPQTFTQNGLNIRGGPGTNYATVGALAAGSAVQPIARNETGDWFQITLPGSGTGWVAGWLLIGAPSPESLPVASDIPTPPPPPPTAPAVASPPQITPGNSDSWISIGEEVEAQGWRFKISSIHKRKTVYYYDSSFVAFGNFLVVIVDATNLQSGTDYFARNLGLLAASLPELKAHLASREASSYAQWQYDGISSMFTDVNPGVFSRMAIAFDIPPEATTVFLGFDDKVWVKLIPFSDMPVED